LTSNLLELRGVSCVFGEVIAVNEISLDVQAGQFITLLGPSGCGKTTTLRLIAGFETPDTGVIRLNKRLIAGDGHFVPPEDRRIGIVFQDYALFPHLNVAQNIAFGVHRSKQAARVAETLELVGLGGYERRMPFELSGGQMQRVALARALAPQPDILLLDEPFSNLDAALRAQLRSEMQMILRRAATTCVFVTHDQEEALSLSDLVAVMFEGRIAQIAPPQTLYERPATREVAGFVGEANWLDGVAQGDFADCALGRVPLIEPSRGPVKLLIRPEMLQLLSPSSDRASGQVLWREYYGYNQRVGLTLASGALLVVRLDSTERITPGERYSLQTKGRVMAYGLSGNEANTPT
jgi:iron(III) transport system ATP-binding protein